MPNLFVAARLTRLKSMNALQAASNHANRLDQTSKLRVRPGANSRRNLWFNPWAGDRLEKLGAPFDLVADFERNRRERNLDIRSNASPVAHVIFQVSPAWIKVAGAPHDPANPRNQQLFECAAAWVTHEFGPDSLLSARLDLDEAGAGTVDLFICAEAKTKTGKGYLSISPRLREIQTRFSSRNTFSALQDAIAAFAQEYLDADLRRGEPKVGRGPDRLPPEAFKADKANKRRKRRLEAVRQGRKLQRQALKEAELQVERQRQEVVAGAEEWAEAVEAHDAYVASKEAELAGGKMDLDLAWTALHDEAAAIREAAREKGLKEAVAGAAAAIEAARDEARIAGKLEALRLAANVRPLPLEKVMTMLSGRPSSGNRWELPSLGPVTISVAKPHRFVAERLKKSGGGAIDLVMMETGFDFARAVRFLATEFSSSDVNADHAYQAMALSRAEVAAVFHETGPAKLEDRAPASSGDQDILIDQMAAAGIDRVLVEGAIAKEKLTATRQGDRVLARWSLTDASGTAVGFGVESVDGSISAIRGASGLVSFGIGNAAKLCADHAAPPPQFWVAATPMEAMAAVSAASRTGMRQLAPNDNAWIATGMTADEATLEAIAERAERDRAAVMICLPENRPGRIQSEILVEKLRRRRLRARNLRWVLRALRVERWGEVGQRLITDATTVIVTLRNALADLVRGRSAAGPRKDDDRGLG